jgi:phenylpropionate dioxygenase-like ring-hydroxylating dioxygenase large terminal subunit
LTPEENELLTRVGPGTPGGEFLRRYWQPAALSEELPPGGAPLPIRLMGEDLVLFRDDAGQPGLLGIHCSHRGADLSYGRLEDGGLRCIYHGWLFDRTGRCLEQPGEPAGSTFHERIKHPAYPCAELGGIVFAYLGPGEPPLLPQYEFLLAPEERRFTTKMFQDCNYLQANEVNLDPQHVPFLHRIFTLNDGSRSFYYSSGTFPALEVEETAFGFRVIRTRPLDDETDFIALTYFVFPNFGTFSGSPEGYGVNWHVPIDDEHHWKFHVEFDRFNPVDKSERAKSFDMLPGYLPRRNKANRYLQDREEMQTTTFTGVGRSFQDHDMLASEGEGQILDRTTEHLGFTDRGVVLMRRQMLEAIRAVQEGRDPRNVIREPEQNQFPELICMSGKVPKGSGWARQWGPPAPVGAR